MQSKTRLFLIVVIVSNAVGNVVLGYGMRGIGDISSYSPAALALSAVRSLGNPWVLLGTALLALFFAAHTLLLSWVDLSYVLLVTSLGYVLVAVLGAAFLGEQISMARWAGILLISAGVSLVGATAPSSSGGGA